MKVLITEHQPEWKQKFVSYQKNIATLLHAILPTIEHIGSTSVPELGAKPIIDILVGVSSPDKLAKVIDPMMSTYTYVKKYEPLWPSRRFFCHFISSTDHPVPSFIDVNDESPTEPGLTSLANIHILVKDTYDWQRHIAFRDYLIAHPSVSRSYYELKKKLSELEFADHNEYNGAKNDFVKKVEKDAMAWYQASNRHSNS